MKVRLCVLACVLIAIAAGCDKEPTGIDHCGIHLLPQDRVLAVGGIVTLTASVCGVHDPEFAFTAEDTTIVQILPARGGVVEVVGKAPGTTRIRTHLLADTTISADASVTVREE